MQEEAREVHLQKKSIDDVQDGIRDDVAAALAGIAAYLASLPPEPVNPPVESDDTVKGAGDAGGTGMHSGDGHRGGGSGKQQREKPDTGEDEDAEPEAET